MRTLLIVSLFVLGCGSAGGGRGSVADAKSTSGDGASTADGSVTINPGFGPGPWGASCTCEGPADCVSGLACGVHDSIAAMVHHCADPATWVRHECETSADCGCGGVCVRSTMHGPTPEKSGLAEECYPPCDAACEALGHCAEGACMF